MATREAAPQVVVSRHGAASFIPAHLVLWRPEDHRCFYISLGKKRVMEQRVRPLGQWPEILTAAPAEDEDWGAGGVPRPRVPGLCSAWPEVDLE